MIRDLTPGPGLALAAFSTACLAVFAINLGIDGDAEFVLSDGAGYYAWARSVFFDGDVRFANEFAAAPWPVEGDARGVDEGPLNKFSIGLSIVELIPIAIATIVVEPFWPTRGLPGYGAAHQLTLALFLLGLGAGAMAAVLRHVQRAVGARAASAASWALVGATGLFEFGSRLISYTHLLDVSLVLVLWRLADQPRAGILRHATLGGLAGLAIVVRMTNAVLLPWVAAWYVYRGRRPSRAEATAAGLATALPLVVQLVANRTHRGTWLAEPYPGERFDWLAPRIADTLWSFDAGWLTWHPVHVVLLAGLLWSWRTFGRSATGRLVWWTAVAAVFAQVWINAAWWSWQGGAMQFGNRLFLALSPMLVLMTAYGSRLAVHRAAPLVLAAMVAWNVYVYGGVSVAKLQGNWDPGLRDAIGWERRIGAAVAERWRRDR